METPFPREVDNYDVWCERCGRVHRNYTFTQEDHDHVIADAAKTLAEAIDREAVDAAVKAFYASKK